MSIISYEGKDNRFTYRGLKLRVAVILDSGQEVVRYNSHVKFSDDAQEERVATKAGSWKSESDAVAEARAEAELIIDERLGQA